MFSFRNIAAICRNDPRGEKAWPRLIGEYADLVLAISPEDTVRELAGLTAEQVRGLVFVMVKPAGSLGPVIVSQRSAPEFAPGLLELLAFDQPDSWTYLPDDDVARLGGRASLREAALANLRALPAPGHHHFDREGGSLDTPPAGCSPCRTCSARSSAAPTPRTGCWRSRSAVGVHMQG